MCFGKRQKSAQLSSPFSKDAKKRYFKRKKTSAVKPLHLCIWGQRSSSVQSCVAITKSTNYDEKWALFYPNIIIGDVAWSTAVVGVNRCGFSDVVLEIFRSLISIFGNMVDLITRSKRKAHVRQKTMSNKKLITQVQGRNEWGKGGAIPRALNHSGGDKCPNNIASTFFCTVHLLPKDLGFEHGGAKLASCPGRHLTSLRPCLGVIQCTVLFSVPQTSLVAVEFPCAFIAISRNKYHEIAEWFWLWQFHLLWLMYHLANKNDHKPLECWIRCDSSSLHRQATHPRHIFQR